MDIPEQAKASSNFEPSYFVPQFLILMLFSYLLLSIQNGPFFGRPNNGLRVFLVCHWSL